MNMIAYVLAAALLALPMLVESAPLPLLPPSPPTPGPSTAVLAPLAGSSDYFARMRLSYDRRDHQAVVVDARTVSARFAAADTTVNATVMVFGYDMAARGDLARAEQVAQAVLDQNPVDARARALLGHARLIAGDYQGAARNLQQAASGAGSDPVHAYRLAFALQLTGDLAGADQALAGIYRNDSGRVDILLLRGLLALNTDRFNAIDLIEQYLEATARTPDPMGRGYVEIARTVRAALARSPIDCEDLLETMGELFGASGNGVAGLPVARFVASRCAAGPVPGLMLAGFFDRLAMYPAEAEALAMARASIKRDTSKALVEDVERNSIRVALIRSDLGAAERALKQAEAFRETGWYGFYEGTLHTMQRRDEQALVAYRRCERAAPSGSEVAQRCRAEIERLTSTLAAVDSGR